MKQRSATGPLRIFVGDRSSFSSALPTPFVYPWWGKPPEDSRDPAAGRFDDYIKVARIRFNRSDLAGCDVAVLPFDWNETEENPSLRREAEQFLEAARMAGKRVVVFYLSDSDRPLRFENAVIFRSSLYESKRLKNEYALPGWSEDLGWRYREKKIDIRRWQERPVVGFCGFAPSPTWRKILKRRFGKILNKAWEDATIRNRALKLLSEDARIKPNFIRRNEFLAGALAGGDRTDYAVLQRSRKEFAENTLQSDYVLCARGAGNFSYRLYETLCCGRIPVFVNTDCVLPFEDRIAWKRLCVWVEAEDLPMIGTTIAGFHKNLEPEGFKVLQKECRSAWLDHLSPKGFFSTLHTQLLELIKSEGDQPLRKGWL